MSMADESDQLGDSPHPTITLTNNSGGDVVVLYAVDAAGNAVAGSAEQGYLQQLELLSLDGQTTLATGVSATVELPLAGDETPTGLQELLISQPGSLFPVHSALVTKDPVTGFYPDLTVTTANARSTQMALNFVRNIMAAPTSNLALGFKDALAAAQEGNQADIPATINAFFAGQAPFNTMTFDDWIAVDSWRQAYAYLWGMADDGTAGRTYWLYPSPFLTVPDAALGTLSLTAIGRGTSDPDDADSGYQITLTRADSTAATLSYDTRMFTDTAGTVALTGSFVNASWISAGAGGATLAPVLVGTLDGTDVIGVSIPPVDGGGTSSDPHDIWMTVMGYIGLVSSLVGFATLAYGIFRWRQARVANADGGEGTKVEQRAAQRAGSAARDAILDDIGVELDDIRDGVANLPDSSHYEGVADRLRADVVDTLTAVTTERVRSAAKSLRKQIGELAEIENTAQLQEQMGNLVEAQGLLADDVAAALSEVRAVSAALPQLVQEMGAAVSAQAKAAIEEALAEVDEEIEMAEALDEDTAQVGDGEEPVEEGAAPVEV